MATILISLSLFNLLLLLLLSAAGRARAATFTLTNNCNYAVWPGILSGAGTAPLQTTGFALSKGESQSLAVPAGWSGRVWGRTLCSADPTGKFACATGDCGSGSVQCAGSGATPPATLAEFTLDGSGGLDFYDVSLVDGYNLPMLVAPQGGSGGGSGSGSGGCASTGCLMDLNPLCPSDLELVESGTGTAVACRSACEAFGSPEYCCSGAYGNPNTCKPSAYSQFFKNACPRAYSYAYDDATSTFTCAGADYAITFCPSPTTSQKSGQNNNNNPQAAAGLPLINNTMVFLGGDQASSAPSIAGPMPVRSLVIAFFAWRFARQMCS